MRPLEARYPELYFKLGEPSMSAAVKGVSTLIPGENIPYDTPPTIHDVIKVVASHYKITDTAFMAALATAIEEFVDAEPEPEEERDAQP